MSGALTLAVFHRSRDVLRLLAPLRRTGHLRVKCFAQSAVPRVPANATGVLWELGADEDVNRRQLSRVLSGVPAASFGIPARHVVDLSRALGFRHHLSVPLRRAEVERALGLPGEHDLSERLADGADRLTALAARGDVIVDTMRVLNLSTDPAMVASTLSARVSEWLPMASWSVVALAGDGSVQFLASRPQDPSLRGPAEAIADVVAQREQAFVSARLAGDARVGESIEAAGLGWPIVAHGVVVGVLVGIDHGRSRTLPRFSPAFRRALTRLLEPAGFALAHALRVARAEALSVTDDLTQLFNSRYLHEVLRKETKRALRSHAPLSLLFVDLDGFKRINDAHGHLLGSRALDEAAALIRGSARETDIVARYGGDEFSLVLPDTTAEGAIAVATRLRDRIARHVFLADHGPGSRLTASIGVATMPEAADTAEGLLEAADTAMYRVKEDGKDGIHLATRGGAALRDMRGVRVVDEKAEGVR
jgi:diguanylate cyclase (GGDEF)-like protein